jgi:hypothetical protein
MKKMLTVLAVLCIGASILLSESTKNENPTLHGNFYLDSDADSDIDPGAENWTNGYFESQTVDRLPVYNSFCQWLEQITRLYKWRILKTEKTEKYYFALFAIGMNDSQLAFCFHHIDGKPHPLKIQVKDVNGRNLRLAQWGPNASLVQEYQVHNKRTGEVSRVRELNGYIIRMRRLPRHLRVAASEVGAKNKVIFDETISNVVDSVRNIQNIGVSKIPDTSTLDKWIKVVGLPNWKLVKKVNNDHGFFAVFKINDKTFAFCRRLYNNPGIYKRSTVLKLTDREYYPLQMHVISVLPLNRRYRVSKMVNNVPQMTKYSIIDGSTYRTEHQLPAKFRIEYIMKGDNNKAVTFFNKMIDFGGDYGERKLNFKK